MRHNDTVCCESPGVAYGFLPIPPIYFHFIISEKIGYFFAPTIGWDKDPA